MARRIRWQILIASISSLLVLGLMSALALSTTAVARPVAGGDFVEGVLSPPQQINPLLSNPADDPTAADLQTLIFDGLMRIGADGLPEPALAAQMPEVSEDGTSYTFTLRSDVTWHDGQPLSADDVVFTLRAIQGQGFSGDPAAAAVFSNVLVDEVDGLRVRCRLITPFAPFPSLATFPILPAHLLRNVPAEQWATNSFSLSPVGTGPYQLTELDASHALLKANSNYYGGAPLIDSVELRFFSTLADAQSALGRGEIDGIGYSATTSLRDTTLPRNITANTALLDNYTILTFNLRDAPLSDQGLRKALATGLDKDTLIETVLPNQVKRLDTPILPGVWSSPEATWYNYSRSQAEDLLSSLGYERGADGLLARDGQALTLPLITDDTPGRLAVAQEIARQWSELGITVEIEQLDGTTLQQRLADHEFVMALHGWQRIGNDPDVLELWHSERGVSGQNYSGLADSQLDQLLSDARQELDFETRVASYADFEKRWIDLVPSIILYQPRYMYLTTTSLGGLELTPDTILYGAEHRFNNINRWYLQSTQEIRGDLRETP